MKRSDRARRSPRAAPGGKTATVAITALVVAVFLAFVPGLDDAFEPPKAALIRSLGLGALAALLVSGASLRRLLQPIDLVWLAWLGSETITTIFSTSPRTSFWGDSHQPEGLLTSLGLTGLYGVARLSLRSEGRRRAVWGGITIAAGAACLYPLLQMAGVDPLSWERTAAYEVSGHAGFRAFGTFGHPNTLGVVTAATLPVAALLFVTERRLRYGAAAALLSLVTVATLSRAAWLGALAGMIVALGLAARSGGLPRPSRRDVMAWAVVCLVVVGALGAWGVQGLVRERVRESLAVGTGSAASRMEIWKGAMAAWLDRPWIGQGPDTFGLLFPHFQTPALWRIEWASHPRHAHSIYLHTLATRGLLGLLMGFAVAAAAAVSWRRARRSESKSDRVTLPAAAGTLIALGVSGGFGALGLSGALLVLISVAAIAGAEGDAGDPLLGTAARAARSPTQATLPRAAWAAGSVVAVVVATWSALELRTLRETDEAWQTRIAAAPRAVTLARRATALWPPQDYPNRVLGDALSWLAMGQPGAEARRTIVGAEGAARRALALVPLRAENAFILGRAIGIREVLGDTSARVGAQAAYELALRRAPHEARMTMEYAEHERIMGRSGHAIALLDPLASLYPDEGSVQYRLGIALAAVGRTDEAQTALARATESQWHEALPERAEAARALARIRGQAPPGRP